MALTAILRFCAVLLFASMLVSCTKKQEESTPTSPPTVSVEPLRICTGTTYSILLTIAEQKGLFALEGLTTELKPYALGREAMEAMLAGECDVATSADTPVADYGLKRDDLRVISGIAKSDNLGCIVAMKSSGIREIKDLKGHRVGATYGTAPHFFLDMVLNKSRLTTKDLKLQFIKGDDLHKAFESGTLDAIATTDMNAYKLEEKFGNAVTLIADPGLVLNHGYLSALDPTLRNKEMQIKCMLSALRAAERIASKNPEEAKNLFTAYLGTSPSVAGRIWENITPKLYLDAAMILTLEDNARWLREKEGNTAANKSFRKVIRTDLLKAVAPESVSSQ